MLKIRSIVILPNVSQLSWLAALPIVNRERNANPKGDSEKLLVRTSCRRKLAFPFGSQESTGRLAVD